LSDAATLAANRAIGRRVLLELWGEGKLEIADELYAPGYIDHVARGPEASVGGWKAAGLPWRQG
jgi:hypothetical protein